MFIFSKVGEEMAGLIDETEALPNERFPSDHSLIAAEIWAVRSADKEDFVEEEDAESDAPSHVDPPT